MLFDSRSYEISPFKKMVLTELTNEQIGPELLRLSKLQPDYLPLNRPVTMSIASLLFERYRIFKQEQSIYECFFHLTLECLRHQQHRLDIRGYIARYEGIQGWEFAFDALVEAAWLRYQAQADRIHRF